VSQSDTGDIEDRMTRLEQQEQQLTQALELLARQDRKPVKTERNWDAAAVIASFIGLLALAVSGYTAYVQRQQLRAQVWPSLQLKFSRTEMRFFTTNQGTGPARITAMRVTVDGTPFPSWPAIQKALGFAGGERLRSSDLVETTLSAGKELTIIDPADNEESRTRFMQLLPGGQHTVSMTICYCSVLDECWVTTLGSPATAIDTCPIPATEGFTH
jgi:hypothetical protein